MPKLDEARTAVTPSSLLARLTGQTIRIQITLLTCILTFAVALTMFWFSYRQTAAVTLQAANDRLEWEARGIANPVKAAFDQLVSDARLIRSSSIPEGYFRALANGGTDPVSGNDIAHWRARFELGFRALMQQRPYYLQMRYVARDGAREIARVDRNTEAQAGTAEPDRIKDRLVTAPPVNLQNGLDTPLFSRALALAPEGVLIVPTPAPASAGPRPERIVTVLLSAQFEGRTVGTVEVTLDYAAMLEHVVRTVRPGSDIVLVDPDGSALRYDVGADRFSLADAAGMRDLVTQISRTDPDHRLSGFALDDATTVSHFQRIALDTQDPAFELGVLAQNPRSEVFAPLAALRQNTVAVGLTLVFGAVMMAFITAEQFTEPLRRMTAEIREASRTGGLLHNLPTARRDEIGDLARSFEALTHRIITSEARAQEVIETVVDGIITIDENGIICDFNPACEKLFGYCRAEVIGRNIGMLMPESDARVHNSYLTHFQLSRGESRVVGKGRDLTALRKDGTTFIMELSVSRAEFENKRYFTGILRDVTARKEMEVMKNEFVSTVNHELRTPLTTIRGALGLLKATSAHLLDAKSKRLLDLSYDGCGRLAHLVNDILDMEKIEAGKMDYRLERLEMNELVTDIVERHTSYADQYRICFVVNPASEPLFCMVDPSRFNQALVNLLSNAAKFSPPGSDVVFTLDAMDDGTFTVTVTDKGPGIPREFRDKIFGKFAQADSSSTRARGGSGLGLNIARSIIVAFGGDITFTTRIGQGTTFCITLPLAEDIVLKRSA